MSGGPASSSDDRHVRILAQPGGKNAAGRAAADDDIVRHFSSRCLPRRRAGAGGTILKSLVPRQEKGYGYRVEGLSYKWRNLATPAEEPGAPRAVSPTRKNTDFNGRFENEGQDNFCAFRQGQPPHADAWARPPAWRRWRCRGCLRAQDKPTLVTSIRSLSNPYHAVWKTGRRGLRQGGRAGARDAGVGRQQREGHRRHQGHAGQDRRQHGAEFRPERHAGRAADRRGLRQGAAPMS